MRSTFQCNNKLISAKPLSETKIPSFDLNQFAKRISQRDLPKLLSRLFDNEARVKSSGFIYIKHGEDGIYKVGRTASTVGMDKRDNRYVFPEIIVFIFSLPLSLSCMNLFYWGCICIEKFWSFEKNSNKVSSSKSSSKYSLWLSVASGISRKAPAFATLNSDDVPSDHPPEVVFLPNKQQCKNKRKAPVIKNNRKAIKTMFSKIIEQQLKRCYQK